MEEKLLIISWDDDNHPKKIWVNGKAIGWEQDIPDLLWNFFKETKGKDYAGYTEISVCAPDDFDNMDEDMADELWDWFTFSADLPTETLNMIKSKDWVALYNFVK